MYSQSSENANIIDLHLLFMYILKDCLSHLQILFI